MSSEDKVFIKEIPESWAQKNFQTLKDFIKNVNSYLSTVPMYGFEHLDLTFDAAVTNHKVDHNIGAIPLDLIQTFLTGSGAVTWNYANFTKDTLDITVTGPCRVRAYVGIHQEGTPL